MFRSTVLALLTAAVILPSPALAQAMVQAVPGTTTADQLAQQMRLLGSNPNDLNALLAAGELSLKLDDLGAAASFFARAEKVDPRNGRAKAGQAAILVHAERPGEALRYFATAESYGLQPTAFASDRALAYDLIGEQERAQRDYRLALRTASAGSEADETRRRYALSLGISGKRDLAEQELQPLIAKKDRGAWRARAFVEAMTGNAAEATHIATTMMPPGTAAGLQPFFQRLPTLGAVDRAFAVHFGEVRGTPQRVADARLVPPLGALGPDPYAPRTVALAAATPAKDKDKGKRKGRKGAEPVAVAAADPVSTRTGAGIAAASVPAMVATPPARLAAAPPPAVPPSAMPAASRQTSSPVTIAAASPMRSTLPPPPAERNVRVASGIAPATLLPANASASVAQRPAAPTAANVTPATGDVRVATNLVTAAPSPTSSSGLRDVEASPVRVASVTPTTAVADASRAAPVMSPVAPMPSVAVAARASGDVPIERATPPAAPAHRDGIGAIVNGLSIPAAELGVSGPRPAAPAPAATEPTSPPDGEALARAAAEREAAERSAAADRAAADRAAAAKALADKKAADRKAAAEKKALAAKKAAAEAKAEEAREAAAQRKLERANPERIWVQVAGGAYAGDLPKAWAAAKKKGGDVFDGHATGYTTPLRFTNRVLAGPFKTDAAARAFVNDLKAKGMSGFTFTSEAGQVVKKLGSDE